MAETPVKRQREDDAELELSKRQKSYKDILSILEEEEDESNQDLSSLITSLQQEISSPPHQSSINDQAYSTSSSYNQEEEEEEEAEKVMRHLLEASDDELGIPNAEDATAAEIDGGMSSVGEIDGGDLLSPVSVEVGDGLWEIQDEAANYYALLQSELFL